MQIGTTTPAQGFRSGASTTAAAAQPSTLSIIRSSADQPVNIPPGTDSTIVKIKFVPSDEVAVVDVKISAKICAKTTSKLNYWNFTLLLFMLSF